MWKRDEGVRAPQGPTTPATPPTAGVPAAQNVLTIGPNGKIKAAVFAKSVIVLGEVVGNVSASEKVDIRDNGSVDGDLISPRVAIAEGAHFRGSIDMQRQGGGAKGDVKASDVKPSDVKPSDMKPASPSPAPAPQPAKV